MGEIRNLLKKLDEAGKIKLVGDLKFELYGSYFVIQINKYGMYCDKCEREHKIVYEIIVDGYPYGPEFCEECLKRNLEIENFDREFVDF